VELPPPLLDPDDDELECDELECDELECDDELEPQLEPEPDDDPHDPHDDPELDEPPNQPDARRLEGDEVEPVDSSSLSALLIATTTPPTAMSTKIATRPPAPLEPSDDGDES
jgi:hypothetical protein